MLCPESPGAVASSQCNSQLSVYQLYASFNFNANRIEDEAPSGTSHREACRPLAVEGLRHGLILAIDRMRCVSMHSSPHFYSSPDPSFPFVNVMGIITIPDISVMIRTIMGGSVRSDVEQAA